MKTINKNLFLGKTFDECLALVKSDDNQICEVNEYLIEFAYAWCEICYLNFENGICVSVFLDDCYED